MERALVRAGALSMSFLLSSLAPAGDLNDIYDDGDRVGLQLQGVVATAPPLVIQGWPTTLQLAQLLDGTYSHLLAVVTWNDSAWRVTKQTIDPARVVSRRYGPTEPAPPTDGCAQDGCSVQAGDPRR